MNTRFRSTRVSFVPRSSQPLSSIYKASIVEQSQNTRPPIISRDLRSSTEITDPEETSPSYKLNFKKSIDFEPVLSHHRNLAQEKRKRERRRKRCPITAIICCSLLSLLLAIGIAMIVTGLILILHGNINTTTVTTSVLTTITTITTSTTVTSTTTSTSTTLTTTITTTTTGTTICPTTSITTTITSTPIPVQCSSYTLLTEATRHASFKNYSYSICDNSTIPSLTITWFRFSGAAGTLIATCALYYPQCGTGSPGWYSGIHPSIAGDTTTGTVCFTAGLNTCQTSNTISVTNCNGFYVYGLIKTPVCDARYCSI